jgi:hypothetical protein
MGGKEVKKFYYAQVVSYSEVVIEVETDKDLSDQELRNRAHGAALCFAEFDHNGSEVREMNEITEDEFRNGD